MDLIRFLNLGNTCYINSVLQCFVNDPEFLKDIGNSTNEILIELSGSIENGNTGNNGIVNLNSTIKKFIKQNPYFTRYEQHDSHEFLTCFLDILDKPIQQKYHGKTKLTIKCKKCNNIKCVFEDFNSINLNVPEDIPGVLIDLFIKYLKLEIHDDVDNLYFCDSCNENTISEKKLILWKLPEKIIIVFKRYSSNGKKNNNTVEFPIDKLVIRESESNKIKEYSLQNIIYHLGNMDNGHYVNGIFHNKEWYLIDDSEVSKIPILNNRNNQSYILVYSSNSPL